MWQAKATVGLAALRAVGRCPLAAILTRERGARAGSVLLAFVAFQGRIAVGYVADITRLAGRSAAGAVRRSVKVWRSDRGRSARC